MAFIIDETLFYIVSLLTTRRWRKNNFKKVECSNYFSTNDQLYKIRKLIQVLIVVNVA